MKTRYIAPVAAVVSGLAALPASAAGIDVTALVANIADQAAPIGLVGGGVLLIYVAVKAFKWVRSALS